MAILNNADIRDTFNYLATIDNVLRKEVSLVYGNKSHLDKIVPSDITNIYSRKFNDAIDFTTRLSITYYESSVIALVASFEKTVFAKYQTTYGALKNVVGISAQRPMAFYDSRERFVSEAGNLSSIIDLIDGHIDSGLFENLKRIKDERDRLAHGKRFGKTPAANMKLEEIAEILDMVISAIEN